MKYRKWKWRCLKFINTAFVHLRLIKRDFLSNWFHNQMNKSHRNHFLTYLIFGYKLKFIGLFEINFPRIRNWKSWNINTVNTQHCSLLHKMYRFLGVESSSGLNIEMKNNFKTRINQFIGTSNIDKHDLRWICWNTNEPNITSTWQVSWENFHTDAKGVDDENDLILFYKQRNARITPWPGRSV